MLAFFAAIVTATSWNFFPATFYETAAHLVVSQQYNTSPLSIAVVHATTVDSSAILQKVEAAPAVTLAIPRVPFYSQFTDIASPTWQKVGCGITDLAMLVNYYHPGAVSVETLLRKGVAAGAYDYNAGWIYQGLIDLSKPYGLTGAYYDLSKLPMETALARFKGYLKDGPVILSVHYKFDPKSTIPHLVVINGIQGDIVYYNDPATTNGTKQISVASFLKGWTRKVIIIRPTASSSNIALARK